MDWRKVKKFKTDYMVFMENKSCGKKVKSNNWKLFDVCPTIDNLNESLLKQSNLDNIELKAKH